MDSLTLIGFASACLGGYFAIMNPLANTTVFISLTANDNEATKKAIARQSILLAFAIIAVLSIVGNLIFKLFGITLPALRITGGIVVFMVGYHMLQGTGSKMHTPSDDDIKKSHEAKLRVAISPLAVPLLAGPGTIATAMSFVAGGEVIHIVISLIAFGVICLITYICFRMSEKIVGFFGQNGLNVITRLMGLVIATIGMGMVITGVINDLKTFVEGFF